MATGDNWPQDDSRSSGGRDDWDRDGGQRAAKPGMSTGMKVLLILLGIGGVFVLACCGIGIYFFSQIQVEEDPAAVARITREIAEIEIPEQFEPEGAFGMNVIVWSLKMVAYSHQQEAGSLALAEMTVDVGGHQKTHELQVRDMLREQGFGQEDLEITSSEKRDFEIRGETESFEFAEAEHRETGEKFRQVSGTFKGKEPDSIGFLILQIQEEHYDEEAAVKMIESIR